MHAKGLVGLGDIVHYQFQIGSVKTDIQSCIYLAVLACMLFPMRLGTTNIWRSRVMELRIVDARRCSSVNAVLNVQTKPASMAATWKSKPLGNVSSTLMYHRLACVEVENAPARYLFAPCTAFCRVDAEPEFDNEAFSFDDALWSRFWVTPHTEFWRADERISSLTETACDVCTDRARTTTPVSAPSPRSHGIELLPRIHRPPPRTIHR